MKINKNCGWYKGVKYGDPCKPNRCNVCGQNYIVIAYDDENEIDYLTGFGKEQKKYGPYIKTDVKLEELVPKLQLINKVESGAVRRSIAFIISMWEIIPGELKKDLHTKVSELLNLIIKEYPEEYKNMSDNFNLNGL